jgi:hypothetical protein
MIRTETDYIHSTSINQIVVHLSLSDLGLRALSGHSFAVSGEAYVPTYGTRPIAEHSWIRTTSFEGRPGHAVGLYVPLTMAQAMPSQRTNDCDDACGSVLTGAHSGPQGRY